MKNLTILIIAFISSCNLAFATQISYPTTWGVNDTVTNVKLNNNQNAVSNVVNGNLDNNNMAAGYKLFQTVAMLPAAGTQGAVDFLTSDNSLNLDTGSVWVKTITPTGTLAVGQIPLYNASWGLLAPGAQNLPLVSNGTSSLPSYQVLPIAGGGTGQATQQAAIDAILPSQGGNSGKFLTTNATNSSWGSVSFSSTAGSYATGTYLIAGPSDITSHSATSYAKQIEIILVRGGTLTIKFGLSDAGNTGNTKFGRIYRNGVAVGTEQSQTSVNWTEYSENISGWNAGDLLQLYTKTDNGAAEVTAGGVRIYENVPVTEIFSTGGVGKNSSSMRWTGTNRSPASNGTYMGTLGSIGDTYLAQAGGATTTLYVKTGASAWTAK